MLDQTPARVYTRQRDLPPFRADCDVSSSAIEIERSHQHIVGIPLPSAYLEALTVEGDTLTATFEAIPCAGGVEAPRVEPPAGAPAHPKMVPDGRPLLLVPATITKIVVIPPGHLICPPTSMRPQ